MQYTKRDWRNRNCIKTANGLLWLTIPVRTKGRFSQRICDVEIADPDWNATHLSSIQHHYARAARFLEYREWIHDLYEAASQRRLSDVNFHFIRAICSLLGVQTQLVWSMEYVVGNPGRTERLAALCEAAGADIYVSGPSARAYLDEDVFREAQIEVEYMDYSGYRDYEQLFPPFEHHVSIVDLILNVGPDTGAFAQETA